MYFINCFQTLVPLVDKVKALYDEAGHRKDWLGVP